MRPWLVGVLTFFAVGLVLIEFTQAAGVIAAVAGIAAGWAQSRHLARV